MQLNQVVTFRDVVLYRLQLCLPKLGLILLTILLWVTSLVQDSLQHIVIREVFQLVFNTCQANLRCCDIQITQVQVCPFLKFMDCTAFLSRGCSLAFEVLLERW